MDVDIPKELKAAIVHRIACIEKPYINAFAGTGRSRKRDTGDIHAIARKILDRTFDPFVFRWDFGNGEPATLNEIYLTVFTALFDIDDDDAKRWSSKTEWDIARHEAASDIARALMRKFAVGKRRLIQSQGDGETRGLGDPGGAHSLSDSRWEDD
ncbi:hypothetical protein J2T08_000549 [Neorhizobium galegae]|uniref:hypothetical protein n=1 Tax=Neorhizobium galegae TaxID=399 RepID=UPI002784A092|nr:hypothetical protein [Neorhizobium galegae]MDQ0132648.1 hypothetical protein [Neorhizobium galegae]